MTDWRTQTVEECLTNLRFGSVKKLQTREYRPFGSFPIIDQGQALIAGWTDDDSGLIEQALPVVVFGDHTRALKYVNFPFVRGADGTQILKPRPDVDPLFFYYALRGVDLQSRGYNRHFKALKEKEIGIPEEGEQADIASVLKLAETALSGQFQEITSWENCKRVVMRELFTRGLRGEAQKKTEIGFVPESWNVVDFGEVREWLQYGTSTPCTYSRTDFPVLRIPNIRTGHVSPEDIKFGKLTTEEANRYRLEKGDLIFIRTNGVIERLGACAVFAGDPAGALFASYLIRARLKRQMIDPYFVAQFFASERGTSIIAGRATPAADGKYNLNTGTIDGLPIPLPPTLDEQCEIVEILRAIDGKINLHQRKRAVLEDLFKALLHKLMTGGVRVADLDLSVLSKAPIEGVAA